MVGTLKGALEGLRIRFRREFAFVDADPYSLIGP